jgi:hypothetical protein
MCKRNNEVHYCNRCCGVETKTITYSDYVISVLVVQHAMRMRRLSSVSGPTLVIQHAMRMRRLSSVSGPTLVIQHAKRMRRLCPVQP